MRTSAWIAGCLVVLAVVAGSQAQTVTLKAAYQPGSYVMTTTADMAQTSTMSSGEIMNQKFKMLMVSEMEVSQPEADGTQAMRLTFKRGSQSVEGPGMTMAYDSAEPASGNSMMGMGLAPMIDKPLTVKMDSTGKVVSVSGINEIWDNVAAEDSRMATMAEAMKQQRGTAYITNMVDWANKMMPPGPVSVGQSWDIERPEPIAMLGEIPLKRHCTLKEIKSTPEGQAAVIEFTASLQKDKVEQATPGAAMTITATNVKMDSTGTLEVLLDSGLPLSLAADQKMSMDIVMKPQASPEQEGETPTMSTSTQQSGKVEVTLKKGKYVPPATAPAAAPPAE
jgi:hypothetical protein